MNVLIVERINRIEGNFVVASARCIALCTLLTIPSFTSARSGKFSVAFSGPNPPKGIVFGKSSLQDVEQAIGVTKESVGFHPNSARIWALGNHTFFEVDAEYTGVNHRYLADYVLVYKDSRDNRDIPTVKHQPILEPVHLGESISNVIAHLRSHFTRRTAYDRECIVWTSVDTASEKPVTIYVAYTNGFVDLIEMDIRK